MLSDHFLSKSHHGAVLDSVSQKERRGEREMSVFKISTASASPVELNDAEELVGTPTPTKETQSPTLLSRSDAVFHGEEHLSFIPQPVQSLIAFPAPPG
ncbi:hypothetical protein E5288_WYG012186 [Bos mutus]|uniref:Uncharacterized protein n=1 Tax=Bos mutus TaxID=72004 RepID=A0A6B0RFH4_9CETA|nr:hypothetical protein [Bos mutus]